MAMTRQVRILMVLICSGLIVLLAAQVGDAATTSQCRYQTNHYNVATYTPSSNGWLTHWGTKAARGIWVPSTAQNPVCIRVSSILAVHQGGDVEVEIGWFEDPTVAFPICSYPLGDTKPRRLAILGLGGFGACVVSGTPPVLSPSSGFEPMNVHETNPGNANCSEANRTGEYAWVDNSTRIATVSGLAMCTGVAVTNSERYSYNGSDNAHAEFDGLMYYGASASWNDWADQGWCYDTDPGYDSAIYSPTHSEVISASNQIITPACFV